MNKLPDTREELESAINAEKISDAGAKRLRELFAEKQARLGAQPQVPGQPQGQGTLRRFAGGLAQGAAGLPNLLALMGTITPANVGAQIARHVQGQPLQMPPQIPLTQTDPSMATAMGRAVGAVPASIMTSGGSGVANALLQLAGNVSGEGASEFARQRGLPGWAQTGIGAVAGAVPGLAKTATEIPGMLAANRASRSVDLARGTVQDVVGDRASALKSLDYELDPATAAARYGTRASTTQALDYVPDLMGSERDVARRVGGFGRDMLEDRKTQLSQLEDYYRSTIARGGSATATGEAVDALRTSIHNDVNAAFTSANAETVKAMPFRPNEVFQASDSIRADVSRSRFIDPESVPTKIMDSLDKESGPWTLDELRGLERRVSNEIFQSTDPTRKHYLGQIADAVDATFNRLAEDGGDDANAVNLLRQAVNLRAKEGRFFNPKIRSASGQMVTNYVAQAFKDNENPAEAVGAILNSRRPLESMARLREMVSDQPGAWEGVQSVMHQRMFGDKFESLFSNPKGTEGRGAIDAVISRLKDEHDVYNYVMDDSRATKNSIDFVKRALKLKETGMAGTTQGVRGAGSATLPNQAGARYATYQAFMQTKTGNFSGAAKSLIKAVRPAKPPTDAEADRLISLAHRYPDVGRLFLELRPMRELPKIKDRILQALTPSAVRTAGENLNREGQRQ